jgi:hypothetical protein
VSNDATAFENGTTTAPVSGQTAVAVEVLPGEKWWGGTVKDGTQMPFDGQTPYFVDLSVAVTASGHPDDAVDSNQASPILVSTAGRVIGSDRPFSITSGNGRITAVGHNIDFFAAETGATLRDAYLAAATRYFPPSGQMPARELMAHPQYNTWIETPVTPTQESVLAYARRILDAGLEPGTLFIDDNWAPDYGTWRFDTSRFPDAPGMIATLREWGFPVVLWLVPFISPDSPSFWDAERKGYVIKGADGRTAIRRWWNGFSAALDLTNPDAVKWLTDQLDALREIGVAGFKFDAGDVRDYRLDDQLFGPAEPVDMSENWAKIGLRYPFNEYRACWRMGGQPLGQRLRDKPPT